MKSKTLHTAYKNEKEEIGIAVHKTYFVKLATGALYVEEGYNLRDLDPEHVASIANAYEAGKYVPAVVVKPTPKGLKIVDGHHRFAAAQQANVEAVEVKNFMGDEADEVSFMITSSQGRNLTPIERAKGYQRLIGQGLTQKEIVKRTGRSASDVKNHLTLLTASPKVQKAVQEGQAGFAAVVEELNRGGFEAEAKIEEKIDKGEKVTRTSLKKWGNKDAGKVMKLLCEYEERLKDVELPEEFWSLLKQYQEV